MWAACSKRAACTSTSERGLPDPRIGLTGPPHRRRLDPGIVLDPDAEVFRRAISIAAGGQQLWDVAPIHADVVQGPLTAECRKVAESVAEKGGEFAAVHLARGHRERAMVDRTDATGVSIAGADRGR